MREPRTVDGSHGASRRRVRAVRPDDRRAPQRRPLRRTFDLESPADAALAFVAAATSTQTKILIVSMSSEVFDWFGSDEAVR